MSRPLPAASLLLALACVSADGGPLPALRGWQPARSTDGAPRQAAAAVVALVGGRLIDGFGGAPLENAVVLIEGRRIAAVGRVGSLRVPDGAQVVSTEGMTILPGLWESHGHLMHIGEGRPTEFPVKFKDRRMEVMSAVARVNLMAGVTSFRDADAEGALAEQQVLRREIEAGTRVGPRLYLSGPTLRQRDWSATAARGEFAVSTPEEARAAVQRLVAAKVDLIRVDGFWSEPILAEVTATSHEAGLGVDADVRHIESVRVALRTGVDRLHHLFTADSLSDFSDDDLRLLVRGERPMALGPSANILRGPYVMPTIEMRKSYARALMFPESVDHPRMREPFAPDIYAYLRETWQNIQSIPWGVGAIERVEAATRKVRHFIEAGGREQLIAGCDAGTPLNVHSPIALEVANLVEAGLSPMEAIQTATLRPAQMQGVDALLGTVTAGKLADIIVVDGDPLQDIEVLHRHVVHVIKDGVVFR